MRSPQGESRTPVDDRERAREICLRQLAVRPRTRAELTATLLRRGVAADVVAEVLDRYDEVGIVDDQAFAEAWVTSRHHGRGLARRALAGELRRKGVADDTIRQAVQDIDAETEDATAAALVRRKLRTANRDRPDLLMRRLVGMLARKGYGAATAIRVVREALAEEEYAASADAELVELAGEALTDLAESEPLGDDGDRPMGHGRIGE